MRRFLQTDKLLHNLVNYIIVFTLSVLINYWVGLTVSLTLSLIKEFIWDKLLKRTVWNIRFN